MNGEETFEKIKRQASVIYAEAGLKEKLTSGRKLKIKLGADPSRPDLHLGHSVVLRMLRVLQDAGHEIVFVIGDFTGMIGDPSGKSKTRVPLTLEETRENGRSYFEQVTKILDQEKTTITYNSEWLAKMNFADVLSLAGKYTLARVMERDDFAKRFKEKSPIGLHELFYPLMQGYDSVAIKADIEVGGTDQTFNLLVGRELQRDNGQPPQEVITFPLLPGLDGVEKMSKSLDNYIGIDEAPEVMFEKCMRVPDSILPDYFRLTTDMAEELYMPLIEEDARGAHFVFATKIVTMYHDSTCAKEAEKRYREVASGGVPDEIEVFLIQEEKIGICALLKKVGLAQSNSEAKRHVLGKGVKIDGVTIENIEFVLDLMQEHIVQFGKGKFIKVKREEEKTV